MIRHHLGRLGPLLALALLFIAGGLLSPTFLTTENLLNVLTRSAIIGIIAIGATFVITARGLDLSVGAMAALVAGLAILAMNGLLGSLGPVGAVIVGMVLALCFGGFARLRKWRAGGMGKDRRLHRDARHHGDHALAGHLDFRWRLDLAGFCAARYRPLYYGTVLSIPVPVLILAILAILGEIAMTRMRFGRHVTAIGSNAEVARQSAIRVDRLRLATYVFQGLCVGLATLVYVPRLGAVTPSTGLLWELEAIAAVIIGGTALAGGYGRVWGTVTGVLILGIVANILNLTDFISPHLNGAFQGAIIIVAVLLQRRKAHD